MNERHEIGYLCSRGHFIFYDDPEADGACGSKRIAGVYVEADYEDDDHFPVDAIIYDARYSLGIDLGRLGE